MIFSNKSRIYCSANNYCEITLKKLVFSNQSPQDKAAKTWLNYHWPVDVHKNDAKSDLNQSNNCFIQPHNVRFEPKFLESVTVCPWFFKKNSHKFRWSRQCRKIQETGINSQLFRVRVFFKELNWRKCPSYPSYHMIMRKKMLMSGNWSG